MWSWLTGQQEETVDKDIEKKKEEMAKLYEKIEFDKPVQAETLMEEIIADFYQDKPISARKNLKILIQAQIAGFLTFQNSELTDKNKRDLIEEFLQKEEIKRLEYTMKIFDEYLPVLKGDLLGWTQFQSNDEARIYYKMEDGLSCVTTYLETEVDAPLLNILSVIAEVDMFKEWAPITPVSDVLKSLTDFKKLVYLKNELSWPFSHREIFFEGGAFALLDDKSICLTLHSIKDATWFGHPITPTQELVVTHVNKGVVNLCKLESGKCKLTLIVNIDPHMDLVPQALMNWGMKNIGGFILDYIKKTAENLPEVYQKSIVDKQEFYAAIRERLLKPIGEV